MVSLAYSEDPSDFYPYHYYNCTICYGSKSEEQENYVIEICAEHIYDSNYHFCSSCEKKVLEYLKEKEEENE